MEPDLARRALGEFIKTQRQQMAPADAGLPAMALAGRRRTPGLRREEVAQLCGISVTWYTWIEQGRTESVSPQALARIADALRLPRAKRTYLFELAGKKDPAAPDQHEESSIAPEILEVVSQFRAPAYLLDRTWNTVAWNPAARKLFGGWLEDRSTRPNLLRFMFASEQARSLTVDWEQRAHRLVAEFRADCAALLDDPAVQRLVDELSACNALFQRAWRLQDVVAREGGERRFRTPQGTELRYLQVNFRVANRPDLKLVTLMPAAD